MPIRSLYLHIPFCKAKCAYCDFDSRAVGCGAHAASGASSGAPDVPPVVGAYCDGLRAQVDRFGSLGELSRVETVYIGGGTPSILGPRLAELAGCVRSYCDPVEFTCEANPDSFTTGLAEALRSAGVTRISLGVQSLDAGELGSIGRIHTASQVIRAAALSKSMGFTTSCDLMCGLPGQTIASWRRTLEGMIAVDPDHISVYPLQLEEGTPLAIREEAGEVEVPDEDFQARCMDLAAELLGSHGYVRYEVASYAKPGRRCAHNIAYWTGVPYLGIGRSAASMCEAASGVLSHIPFGEAGEGSLTRPDLTGGRPGSSDDSAAARGGRPGRVRFRQLDDGGGRFDVEVLTARQAVAEDLMLACRMTDGIGPDLLERARAHIPAAELDAACVRAVERGLARWAGGSLKPTHLGWLEGNELFGIFWDLAD